MHVDILFSPPSQFVIPSLVIEGEDPVYTLQALPGYLRLNLRAGDNSEQLEDARHAGVAVDSRVEPWGEIPEDRLIYEIGQCMIE